MQISNEHMVCQYAAASFGASVKVDLQRGIGQVLQRPMAVVEVPPGGVSVEDSDTGTEPLRAFLDRAEPLRQELAAKRIRGEQLPLKEQLVLQVLNNILDALLTPPAPEAPDVNQALSEARRLLEKYANG